MALDRNGQYEIDGLLMGIGTVYVVEEVHGLGGIPELKVPEDADLPLDDGGYAGTDRLGEREIIMAVGLDGVPEHSSYDDLIEALGLVMRPRAADVTFRYQRFGRIRRLLVRPRGFILPWDEDFFMGAGRSALRLIAKDPLSYSDSLASTGPSSGAFNVTNAGNHPVWPTVTTAAGGDVTLTNTTTGEAVVIEGLSGAAVIDFKRRTVEVAGVDEYGAVQAAPEWWRLQPGLNALDFTASGTITHRDGWTTG